MTVTGTAKPNLTLIAAKCGLSTMTVSRVLRNQPNVAEQTRELVLRTAESLGFMPDGRYQGQTPAETRNYFVLFQRQYSVSDAYFSEIILSIQKELFARGFGCSFGVVDHDYGEFLKLNAMLRSHKAAGVLVVGEVPAEYVSTLQKNFQNLVLIDYPGDPTIEQPYNAVCVDNVYGAHLGTNHLLSLGRKRIVLIGGREGHYFSNDLLRGYRGALAKRDVEFDPRLVVHGNFHVEGGYQAAEAALEAGTVFDGIFSNDEMACGAIRAVSVRGIRVPQDVSVVGFDGLPVGEMLHPTLTTVVVDREKMGRMAVERLLAAEEKVTDTDQFEKISVFPSLLIRESCGGQRERHAAWAECGGNIE